MLYPATYRERCATQRKLFIFGYIWEVAAVFLIFFLLSNVVIKVKITMDKYLLQILHEINTIIIPDLGALTITNAATGEIMFMSYLKYDDGKLWKHIAEKEGMDENDAKNLIAKYVREIKLKLDQGETYDMYQFGRFFKNNDGDIDFLNWSEIPAPGSVDEIPATAPVVVEEANSEEANTEEEVVSAVQEEEIVSEPVAGISVEEREEAREIEAANSSTEDAVELQPQITPAVTTDLDAILKAAETPAESVETKDAETSVERSIETQEAKEEVKKEEIPVEAPVSHAELDTPSPELPKEEKVEEVLKEKLEKSKTENIYLTPEEVSTIETLNIEVPTTETKEPASAPQKKKKGAGYWLVMILGMLVIFGGTFAFVFYEELKGSSTEKTEKVEKKEAPEEYLDEIISEENSEVSEETMLEERSDVPTPEFNETGKKAEKVAPAVPVETKAKTTTNTQANASSSGNFHVIVGSFGVEENARKLANKLSSEGKNASVLGPKNGMYLVSAGSFATQAEAASEVSSIGNAWILKK
jgi:hypothetical protein